ncbi:citrate lyase subunit alpha [Oribacterium sp. FC2011]|uniref:citrate lyase subunit alpha n=1 Tax=Oribacterium sp. FC2011 TaxID=1408311 RepID=UPI0004E25D27|nr:citrate lyase subunit alpha [Oribacterium sp. FC2011]
MINAVGREIPDEILRKYGKEPFSGVHYRDNKPYKKAEVTACGMVDPMRNKMVSSIREAMEKCNAHDGMVFSFHHHFRDGDHIVNMVMQTAFEMGLKDLTVCASSLGAAHSVVADLIEKGIVTGIQTSGIRDRIGEAVSYGKLKTPAIIRSHGGRVRAIEEGDVHIDIAFIGAPTADEYGNLRAVGGKSDCGVLSYSMVDAKYADYTVAITDTLVPFPNYPPSIPMTDVDYVCVVDEIGNPAKIASNVIRMTQDVRELKMAEDCAKVMAATPFFKDGFSFQTGGGGASLAVTRFLEPLMEERNIKMSFAIGGITKPMCDLLEKGYIRTVVDAQCFDKTAIESVKNDPRHYEISTSEYANPLNKGAFVNKLDFVILGALEIDTGFNVNVTTGSDGVLRGAPGGHPDTAAGSRCSIIVAPLIRGRIPTVVERVVNVTTPGEAVDVLVTDYGVAINPKRKDLIECLSASGLRIVTIQELLSTALNIVGKPEPIHFEDDIVGIIESRDGTIMDVVRRIKPQTEIHEIIG